MKTIIESILDKIPDLTKVRKQFLIHIFALIVSLRGRVNFLNMERQGTYSEKSYRLHFEQNFDHFTFNKHLIETYCSGHKIIATDCSYIPKSGKKTPNIGNFWSGCASKALKGLEISSLAVIDVDIAFPNLTKNKIQQNLFIQRFCEIFIFRNQTGNAIKNLKELRVQHRGKSFKIFFAFDIIRQAVMLCGGDKTGDKHFYETMIPIAENEFLAYLHTLE